METKETLLDYLKKVELHFKNEADEGDEKQGNEFFKLYKKAVELRLWLTDRLIWSAPKKNEASQLLNEFLAELKLDESQDNTLRMLIQNYAESHREDKI